MHRTTLEGIYNDNEFTCNRCLVDLDGQGYDLSQHYTHVGCSRCHGQWMNLAGTMIQCVRPIRPKTTPEGSY